MRNRTLFLVFTFIFIFSSHTIFAQAPVIQLDNQQILIPAPPTQEPERTQWLKRELLRFVSGLDDSGEIKKLHDLLVLHYEIQDHYVDSKTLAELLDLAMVGMVEGLDPYSHLFIDERATALYKEFNEERNYIGTGIVLTSFGKNIFVAEVIDNSPSAKAGIEPGDLIVGVDGKKIYGLSSSDVRNLIRGSAKENESVVIEIKNSRLQKPRFVTIVKQQVVIKSVTLREIGKDIVCAKIRAFLPEDEVVTEFREVLRKASRKKLIIDLRNNGGGSLASVNLMTGFIVGPNRLLVTLTGKNKESNTIMTPISSRIAPADLPSKIIVLVNNNSASASEIMAGALQHYKKAVILGIRTFGKATAQNYLGVDKPGHNLEDSQLIMGITVGRYYLPDGTNITGNGVQPDVEVEQPELFRVYEYGTKKDRQLQEAIKILKRK